MASLRGSRTGLRGGALTLGLTLLALAVGVVLLRPGAVLVEPGSRVRGQVPAVVAQFHGMWSDYTDEQRERVLDELRTAGVGWVRIDLSWAMLQPDSAEEHSDWGV